MDLSGLRTFRRTDCAADGSAANAQKPAYAAARNLNSVGFTTGVFAREPSLFLSSTKP